MLTEKPRKWPHSYSQKAFGRKNRRNVLLEYISSLLCGSKSIFAFVRPKIDLRFDHSRKPSLLELYGNRETVLALLNAGYAYPWPDNAPELSDVGLRSHMLRDNALNANVRALVSILFSRLRLAPDFMWKSYRDFYHLYRSINDTNIAIENVEVHGTVILDYIINVESYQGPHDVSKETNISDGCPWKDRLGLPAFLRSFNVSSCGFHRPKESAILITGIKNRLVVKIKGEPFVFDVWSLPG